MLRQKWSIGSDPELFLENPDGTFINAFEGISQGLLWGTKATPEMTAYGAIQVDGMAVEFNTHPTDNPSKFYDMINAGISDACIRFGKAVPSFESTKHFDPSWLLRQHPCAIELGCDPDYNAWQRGEPNPRPDMINPCRTAGGHIHIGWKDPHIPVIDVGAHVDQCCDIVKHLDYVLGVWSVPLDTNGKERRKMYGTAGAFRPKDYGVEYRVLSNFWIFHRQAAESVVKRSLAGMNAYADGLKLDHIFGDEAIRILKDESAHTYSIWNEVNTLLRPYLEEVENAAA